MKTKIYLAFLTALNVIMLCAFDNIADSELLTYGLIMRLIVLFMIIANAAVMFWSIFGLLQMDPTEG